MRKIVLFMGLFLPFLFLAGCSAPVETPAAVSTYTVTYDANGGTGSVPVDSAKYAAGSAVTVLPNSGPLAKSDYAFTGWNTKADGSGTSYDPGASLTMGSTDVTLYAKWSLIVTCTVTYDANGGTGSVPVDPAKYLTGTTVTVLAPEASLAKTGFVFTGWNTKSDRSGKSYAASATFIMESANVTLYAMWNATVTYDKAGASSGTVPVDTANYASGATVKVLGNTGNLEKAGAAFVGWNTDALYAGTAYSPDATFTMGDEPVVLYAMWGNVVYDGNGNTGGCVPVDDNFYASTQTVAVKPNSGLLVKTNYAFAGWNTAKDGTGSQYSGFNPYGSFTKGAGTTTLYARWNPQITMVSSGGNHTLFVTKEGDLWAAGQNASGQFGSSSPVSSSLPIKIMGGVKSAAAISTGSTTTGTSLILKSDGTLLGIGRNYYGQLGTGNTTDQTTLFTIATNVASISLSDDHAAYIKTNGNMYAMGDNTYGQLGSAATGPVTSPYFCASSAAFVSAKVSSTAFITPPGALYVMGSNSGGEIGQGVANPKVQTPTLLTGFTDVLSVSINGRHNYTFCLIVKKDGTLWATGKNDSGQLGLDNLVTQYTPVQVPGMTDVVSVATGPTHSMILKKDGTLWATGDNSAYQFGNGTSSSVKKPIQVASDVAAVFAGGNSNGTSTWAPTFIVKTDGTLWATGANSSGQLGVGTTSTYVSEWQQILF
jgi:uncharacterized repeat protein (TIGR02543 family)